QTALRERRGHGRNDHRLAVHQGAVTVENDARHRRYFVSAGCIRDLLSERGSRSVQRPCSTVLKNCSSAWLKAAGSSRLMAWPVRGAIHSPALGIVRFM